MRPWMVFGVAVASLAAVAAPVSAESVWSASCTGALSVQYLQTVGGDGFLHLGNSDGSFTTIKLKQSYHKQQIICGSTVAKAKPKEIAAICADNDKQVIRLVYGAQVDKGVKPEQAATYCEAQVTVN